MMVVSSENEDNLLVIYELGVITGMLLDYEPYVFGEYEPASVYKQIAEFIKVMGRI
jgi:hypothetical protein